jgi:adenosylmethionine-8-amino-7-oxononanoate aminotransferase
MRAVFEMLAAYAQRGAAIETEAEVAQLSGSRILHRTIGSGLPIAVAGSGVTIRDADGNDYIDASGGAAVSCLGHGHPDILKAMRDQMDKLEYAHTSFFTTEAAEALADDLVQHAPPGLGRVYLVSGGSEAMEAALKLARQSCVERGEADRTRIIARRQSYHGNTLGALAVGGHVARRETFKPLLFEAHHIEPCYQYRHRLPEEDEEAYGLRAADALEAALLDLGPETVIAFVAETVVGATAGALTPAPGYFRRIREICDRYGVLLILDEVMCGMGRTGTLHACEQEDVTPDLMTVAKGLGAGYQPIGAVLMADAIYDAIAAGSGAFRHGHTYIGHPIPCAAALAVQQVIRRDNLLENVRREGERLQAGLEERFDNHAHIGEVRGRGLFHAIELVADRGTKMPFAPELDVAGRIKRAAMARGLCVYPGQGTADARAATTCFWRRRSLPTTGRSTRSSRGSAMPSMRHSAM